MIYETKNDLIRDTEIRRQIAKSKLMSLKEWLANEDETIKFSGVKTETSEKTFVNLVCSFDDIEGYIDLIYDYMKKTLD